MEEVQLRILDMSSTIQPSDAYALVLEEVEGTRKLPIIIGAQEAQVIKVAMATSDARLPRPMTHDLMLSIILRLGAVVKKILIYKVKDGVFYTYIFLERDGADILVDARTTDALVLALKSGCPIYTTETIMDLEHLRVLDNNSYVVNSNLVDLKTLKGALEMAIEAENYELASRLRDEIKLREESGEVEQ